MDYRLATLEELATYFAASPCSRISRQLNHYRKKGDEEMVEKILEARRINGRKKIQKVLESLG